MIKDIVYATSESYAPIMCVSLASLFENNKDISFNIYIIENNVSLYTQRKIKLFIEENKCSCHFIRVNDYSSLSSKKLEVHKLSLSTYSRLLLPNLLPDEIEFVLYIDCDTIIISSISELLSTNIEAYGIAGVEDAIHPKEKEKIHMSSDTRYINAGILLINLKYWRTNKIFPLFSKVIENFDGKVPYLDQGIINSVFSERLILDLKYNVQTPVFAIHTYGRLLKYFGMDKYYSHSEFIDSRKNPKIIHFTSFYIGRPWHKHCKHPYRKDFDKYKKLTPFKLMKQISRESLSIKLKNFVFRNLQPLYFILKK